MTNTAESLADSFRELALRQPTAAQVAEERNRLQLVEAQRAADLKQARTDFIEFVRIGAQLVASTLQDVGAIPTVFSNAKWRKGLTNGYILRSDHRYSKADRADNIQLYLDHTTKSRYTDRAQDRKLIVIAQTGELAVTGSYRNLSQIDANPIFTQWFNEDSIKEPADSVALQMTAQQDMEQTIKRYARTRPA